MKYVVHISQESLKKLLGNKVIKIVDPKPKSKKTKYKIPPEKPMELSTWR